MPDPTHRPAAPFDEETPERTTVTGDEEDLPARPPREGSPLVDPDVAPGVPPDSVPPGPGSPR